MARYMHVHIVSKDDGTLVQEERRCGEFRDDRNEMQQRMRLIRDMIEFVAQCPYPYTVDGNADEGFTFHCEYRCVRCSNLHSVDARFYVNDHRCDPMLDAMAEMPGAPYEPATVPSLVIDQINTLMNRSQA